MDILKAAAHRVLAAYRGELQAHLRFECAEQRGKGLAPAHLISAELFKILLKGEIAAFKACAARNELCDGAYDRRICARERVSLRKVRVKAVAHDGAGRGLAVSYGEFACHDLRRGQEIPSAEGQKHRACADGRIEAFRKSLTGADVYIGNERNQFFFEGTVFYNLRNGFPLGNLRLRTLLCAVGIQKSPRNIDYLFAPMPHYHAARIGYFGNNRCFKIFLIRKRKEGFRVLFLHNDRHALLRFAYGKLGTVKAFVFFRNLIKVDFERVRKLTYRDRNSAGTEIIAALYQLCGFVI